MGTRNKKGDVETYAHNFKIDTNLKNDCVGISYLLDISTLTRSVFNEPCVRVFNGIYDANLWLNETFNITVNDI